MKILFIRAPRYLWPIINESDNFLMPLNYPMLAAAIREKFPDINIKIIDCLPLKIGWNSLRKLLEKEKPDIVGCGDEQVYQHEGMRCLKLAKELNPSVITIAGGHFHSFVPADTLSKGFVDYVVRFEGERTIVELIEAISENKPLERIKGIAFKREGKVIINSPRPLIDNLDDLPFPAIDLMPIEKYSPFGKLWPRSGTIESSRGCFGNCSFCSLWGLMGDRYINENGEEVVKPRYRQKSVERTMEEIDILYNKYKRRYLFWIDATWNTNPQWVDSLCEEIFKRDIRFVGQWAFVRADLLIRDEKLGVLEKMVKAGLSHVLIGIERHEDEDYDKIGKPEYTTEIALECYDILKRKYPRVFRQATFLVGAPWETRESMLKMVDFAVKLGVDYPAFHTMTPQVGTDLWREAVKNKWIEVENYSNYDWYTPIMPSKYMSRKEIADTLKEMQKRFVIYRPHWAIKGLFSSNPLRRGIYTWFFGVVLKMMFFDVLETMLGKKKFEGATGLMKLHKPNWYDD